MTKYSKIKKSSFAILALSLILVAVLAFGGTYAYFSDKATSGNASVTTGTLNLTDSITLTVEEESLVPNQSEKLGLSDIALAGNTISAIRFTLSDVSLTGGKSGTLSADQKKLLTVEVTEAEVDATGWVDGSDGYFYYNDYVDTLDVDASLTVTIALDAEAGNEWQGITATFTITFEVVQAEFNGSLGEAPEFDLTAAKALPWNKVVANPAA